MLIAKYIQGLTGEVILQFLYGFTKKCEQKARIAFVKE